MSTEAAPTPTPAPEAAAAPATPAPAVAAPEAAPAAQPAPEAQKKDPALARMMAMAAKKDRELQLLQQRVKELEPKAAEVDEIRGAKSAIKALQRLGYTFEQAQEEILSGGRADPHAEATERLSKEQSTLKAQIEEMRRQKEADESARLNAFRAQKVSEFKGQILEAAKKDPAYGYSAAHGEEAVEMAFAHIDRHYNSTSVVDEDGTVLEAGEILSIPQALAEVEKQLEARAERLLTIEKFKSKLGAATSKQASTQAASESGRAARTLTNSAAATPAKPVTGPLTWEQRQANALAALKNRGG